MKKNLSMWILIFRKISKFKFREIYLFDFRKLKVTAKLVAIRYRRNDGIWKSTLFNHANVILSKTCNYFQAALIWYKIVKLILTKKEESSPTKLQASTLQINTIIY